MPSEVGVDRGGDGGDIGPHGGHDLAHALEAGDPPLKCVDPGV
jgi:hypothetical protein